MEDRKIRVLGKISRRFLTMVTHEGSCHEGTIYVNMDGENVGEVPNTAFDINAARVIFRFLLKSFPELGAEIPEDTEYEQLVASYKAKERT